MNKYLTKIAQVGFSLRKGRLQRHVSLGMSAAGLGLGINSNMTSRANHKDSLEKTRLEQESLSALHDISTKLKAQPRIVVKIAPPPKVVL